MRKSLKGSSLISAMVLLYFSNCCPIVSSLTCASGSRVFCRDAHSDNSHCTAKAITFRRYLRAVSRTMARKPASRPVLSTTDLSPLLHLADRIMFNRIRASGVALNSPEESAVNCRYRSVDNTSVSSKRDLHKVDFPDPDTPIKTTTGCSKIRSRACVSSMLESYRQIHTAERRK